MQTTLQDFTGDHRFETMRLLNKHLLAHPLDNFKNILVQHEIGKSMLPEASGHLLVPTVYGFPMEIDLDTSHTETMKGSIERNLYFLGTYEAGTLNVIKQSLAAWGDDACFVDIGAHNGLMSIFATQNGASKVYSFEPNPPMFELLQENIKRSGYTNITPFAIALGDKKQTVSIEINPENSGAAHIANQPAGDAADIPMATLDSIAEENGIGPVHLMLLDIEGYEMMALTGAEKTISTYTPDLIVEYDPRNQDESVLEFLKGHGYKLYRLPHTRHVVSDLIPFASTPETDLMDNLFCFQPDRAEKLGLH